MYNCQVLQNNLTWRMAIIIIIMLPFQAIATAPSAPRPKHGDGHQGRIQKVRRKEHRQLLHVNADVHVHKTLMRCA
jgi:hypothetical protein